MTTRPVPSREMSEDEVVRHRELIKRIEHDLSLHSPKDDTVAAALDDLRHEAKVLGRLIAFHTPPSREQSLAITNLEQTLQWAIAAIVRHQQQ